MPESGLPIPYEDDTEELPTQEVADAEGGDFEDEESDDSSEQTELADPTASSVQPKRKKKKMLKTDAEEFRLLGRRALCKKIGDIASFMQRIVKNRVLKDHPYAKKMEDDELTNLLKK